MRRNEVKSKPVRKPLNVVTNNNYNGVRRLPKSTKAKSTKPEEKYSDGNDFGDGGASVNRLLLVQSDLSAVLCQIDELVVQAQKVKTTKHGSKEIESFADVLSEMLSTLKPWVPRFQNILSNPIKSENQPRPSFLSKPASIENGEGKSEIGSPEDQEDTLISPSPLVSWRGNCTIERNRQLFLLTPLPMSKSFSSKHQGTSKSAMDRIDPNRITELPEFLRIPGDSNDDLLEGLTIQPTPKKPFDSITTGRTARALEAGDVTSPILSKRNNLVLLTPGLTMSPPKTCVLLEPSSESSHQSTDRIMRKSTPFPLGDQNYQDSSSTEVSEDLTVKYAELLGIRQACKTGIIKKELSSTPEWLFSPPRTCAVLELPDEDEQENAALDNELPAISTVINIQTIKSPSKVKEYNDPTACHQLKTSRLPETVRSNLSFTESTPLWKEPESSFRTGKRPGENTLKKELWTRFDSATTSGTCYNPAAWQKTTRKGFLDMLEEASCDDEDPILGKFR